MNAETSDPRSICEQVIADGVVTSDEVRQLQNHVDTDWVICREDADLLFRVNNAARECKKNCKEWPEFFASTIARFIVFDMNTPGQVDRDEAEWLRAHFQSGQPLTETEKRLFREIRRMAPQCCESLEEYFTAARSAPTARG
jgi:hypothetical protein